MARREPTLRNVSEKTKDVASAAGEAVGQAAINVAHLALGQARAVVASADRMLRRSKPRAKAKAKQAKTEIKRRVTAGKKVVRKITRKAAQASVTRVRAAKRRVSK